MSSSGYIYCFSNPSLLGMVKVGMTTRYIEERLQEANHCGTWGPPTPYVIEFAKKVNNPREKEKALHRLLEKYSERVNTNREFFKIAVIDVKLFFDFVDGEYWSKEVNQNTLLCAKYNPTEINNNESVLDTQDDNVVNINNEEDHTNNVYNYTFNKYRCELCKYYTDRKQNYQTHIESEKHNFRKQNTFLRYTCKICNKTYQSSGGLSKHKRKCKNKYNNINRLLIQNTVSTLQQILDFNSNCKTFNKNEK